MPWKSEKQRRWAHATNQPWAKEWDNKYNDGGTAMFNKKEADKYLAQVARSQGRPAALALVDKYRHMLSPQDVRAAMRVINMNDGGNVPMYNQGGGLMNHPYNREGQQFDTVPAMLTPGEFVVDADSAHKFKDDLKRINDWEPKPGKKEEPMSGEQYIAEDEAVEIKRKFKDGTEIIVKSPEGSKTEVSGLLKSLVGAAKGAGLEPVQMKNEGGYIMDSQVYPGGIFVDPNEDVSKNTDFWGSLTNEYATRFGIPFTDHMLEKVEAMLKEAWSDWNTLPDYEQNEYGNDFMQFAHGVYGVSGEYYNKGGMVRGYNEGGAVYNEGDTIYIQGAGTLEYRNGQWVNKRSGNPAPDWVIERGLITPDKVTKAEVMTNGNTSDTGANTASGSGASSGGALDLTEGEAKSQAWARRAINAEKVLRELYDEGFNPTSLSHSKSELVAGLLGDNDLFRGEQAQRYKRAVTAFALSVLRKDTGAQISAGEYDWVLKTYFPSLGSGEKVSEDLANIRNDEIQSFIDASGPASAALQTEFDKVIGSRSGSGSLVTGEDIGSLIGGTVGAISGGILGSAGGPVGAVAGAAGGGATGSVIGGNIGEYIDTGKLDADINDAINFVLGGIGGIGGKGIQLTVKGVRAIAKAIGARMGGNISAKELAEMAVKEAVEAQLGGGTVGRSVAGRVAGGLLDKAAKGGAVNYGGKPFQVITTEAGETVIDLTTGKAVRGKLAKDVIKASQGSGGGLLG